MLSQAYLAQLLQNCLGISFRWTWTPPVGGNARRAVGERIFLIDVPLRAGDDFIVAIRVNHLDTVTAGIDAVREPLPRAETDRSIVLSLWILPIIGSGELGKRRIWLCERREVASNELGKLFCRRDFVEFEGHGVKQATIGALPGSRAWLKVRAHADATRYIFIAAYVLVGKPLAVRGRKIEV